MARQVGPTVERFTEKGNRFIATFFVSKAELPSYLVPYGTDMSALFGVPAPCTAYDTSNREAGTGPDGSTLYYLVSIWANGNYSEGLPRMPDPSFATISYTVKPEYMDPKWFGVIQATEKILYDNNTPPGLYTGSARPNNIDGQPANLEDYIYANWKAETDPNTPIYTRLPYSNVSLEPTDIPLIVNQEFPKLTCTIQWMIQSNQINNFATFIGVSGGFSNRPELTPVDARAGVWKAIEQEITTYKQNGSATWCKVKRTIEKCPLYDAYGCVWLPNKNGGTWSW